MALRSLSAQRGFCCCAALRKFCPSFLLHCSLSLWDGLLQMVPVPDYFMSCICPFTLRKPTAVAIVPEKLVNASNRKTFSAASIEWSKLAWHLLASLDYCASQAGSVLKPSLWSASIHTWTPQHSDCFLETMMLLVYVLSESLKAVIVVS